MDTIHFHVNSYTQQRVLIMQQRGDCIVVVQKYKFFLSLLWFDGLPLDAHSLYVISINSLFLLFFSGNYIFWRFFISMENGELPAAPAERCVISMFMGNSQSTHIILIFSFTFTNEPKFFVFVCRAGVLTFYVWYLYI